jgi:hypothetical protein
MRIWNNGLDIALANQVFNQDVPLLTGYSPAQHIRSNQTKPDHTRPTVSAPAVRHKRDERALRWETANSPAGKGGAHRLIPTQQRHLETGIQYLFDATPELDMKHSSG